MNNCNGSIDELVALVKRECLVVAERTVDCDRN